MQLTATIDWLEFTVLNAQLPTVLEILNLEFEDFSPLSTGRFGYNAQMKWKDGSIFLMFSTKSDQIDSKVKINPKKGAHVMITGQGCRHYSVNNNLTTLISILSALKNVNFSRIDLALDDFESQILSYDQINETALARSFTSRWSKWDELVSRQTSTGAYLGRTMYFGSQASDLFCRIYDKTLERKANADIDIKTQWTRLELVYRKDRAKMLVKHLMSGKSIGTIIKGTLKQYIRFLIPSSDKNKSRWPTAPWWALLLENVEKLQLTIKKEARSIDQMEDWVEKQIAPTIAAITKARQGDMRWIRGILIDGGKRLSKRHEDAIHQYIQKESIIA